MFLSSNTFKGKSFSCLFRLKKAMSHLIPWRWKASPLPSPLRNFSCQHKVRLQLWIWIFGLRFGPGQDSPLAERGCDENWFCQGFNFLHVNILINLTCEDLNISDKCWLYLDWFCEGLNFLDKLFWLILWSQVWATCCRELVAPWACGLDSASFRLSYFIFL